jgi:single-strand selective monofunctional uracil DNA glycosylase
MNLQKITDQLLENLAPLRFGPPVTYVYNPLRYARKSYDQYLRKYGRGHKQVVLLGMNPGPWGMVQTGVPFGDVVCVRKWLNIEAPVGKPEHEHPKRPVKGFDCEKREVSGRRLWGWAHRSFDTPENFFSRFFVANYCPLVFMESGGKNRTPDKLKKTEKEPLLQYCDQALRRLVECLQPQFVIGIGKFARCCAERALDRVACTIAEVTHPSPANPKANRGWGKQMDRVLSDLEII